MPFNTDNVSDVVVINNLQSQYSHLHRHDVKARLYAYVLTRNTVVDFIRLYRDHYVLPVSFEELRENSSSSARFMEEVYNHLESTERQNDTIPRLSEVLNTVLSNLERELLHLNEEAINHRIHVYMRGTSQYIQTLPSYLFRSRSSTDSFTISNNYRVPPRNWAVYTEEPSAQAILVDDVNESNDTPIEQGLRRRGMGDGLDSPLHNARLLYSSCYGLYKDKIVYISNFDGEAKPKARVHELQNHSPAEAYASVPMDTVKLGFNFEFGWVHLPDRNLFSYTAYLPGNYLKGASKKNTKVLGTIMSDTPLSPFVPHDYIRPEHIESLFSRKFTSFEEGINSKKEIFIVSPHVLVCSQLVKEKVQKKVYFNTTIVGVLNEKYKYVKIYKKFTNLLPLFRTVIPYEIR